MKFIIELHPLAEQELTESYQWYEKRSAGLGLRFINSINKKLTQIQENPNKYAVRYKSFREVSIEIFPYSIIYEIFEDKEVVFVSYIFHVKQNPKRKYKR